MPWDSALPQDFTANSWTRSEQLSPLLPRLFHSFPTLSASVPRGPLVLQPRRVPLALRNLLPPPQTPHNRRNLLLMHLPLVLVHFFMLTVAPDIDGFASRPQDNMPDVQSGNGYWGDGE